MNTETETNQKYVRPEITVLVMNPDEVMQANQGVVTSPGDTSTIYAKPGDFEDEEDVEPDKWGTTLPTSVPDAWKQVGE